MGSFPETYNDPFFFFFSCSVHVAFGFREKINWF